MVGTEPESHVPLARGVAVRQEELEEPAIPQMDPEVAPNLDTTGPKYANQHGVPRMHGGSTPISTDCRAA